MSGSTQQSTPLVANGVIYLAGQGVVAASAATGHILWDNPLTYTQSQLSAPAILSGSILYVACNDGSGAHNQVVALDAHTGAQLWAVVMPDSPNTPALA